MIEMYADAQNEFIWISPDWNVNELNDRVVFIGNLIWISPDWNVNWVGYKILCFQIALFEYHQIGM